MLYGNKITGLDDPTSNQDAATKYYVDNNGSWVGTATSHLDMDAYDIINCFQFTGEDVYCSRVLGDGGSSLNLDGNGYVIISLNSIEPYSDNNRNLGSSSYRWANVYCTTLTEGDHVYSERICALCGKDFVEGESTVNYILSNKEEGTRTINCNCKTSRN
jgi:hypothetical protein